MSQHVYDIIVTQFTRSLLGLEQCLIAAKNFAKERGFDENSFLTLKAAPDMFPLVRQVQITTDTAKGAVSRLSGKTAPVFEDKETTIDELIVRIGKTVHYLKEFKPADFNNYTEQTVRFPWAKGVYLKGKDYFETHAVPNFYFHFTTMYVLLRNAGVNIGKKDFVGNQPWIKE